MNEFSFYTERQCRYANTPTHDPVFVDIFQKYARYAKNNRGTVLQTHDTRAVHIL
jgi:hypothetical protein